MFKQVVEKHGIMPSFIDLVECFHKKINNAEEGYCAPFLKSFSSNKSEYAYMFKYTEDNNRTDGGDPWSIRQTGVYHQYDAQSDRSVWILLNPKPDSMGENRLFECIERLHVNPTHIRIHGAMHRMIISSYVDNWKRYLSGYESQMIDMTTSLLGISVEQRSNLSYDDLGTIRYVESRCLPLRPILLSFCRCMTELQSVLLTLNGSHSGTGDPVNLIDQSWISEYLQKATAHTDYAEAILNRCSFAAQLLRDTLGFRDTREFQKQTKFSLELTRLTVDDSATVRVITVITLIYLSVSVVATVLSTPFFFLDSDSKALEVSFQFWIFLAVSLPLTLLTIGYWQFNMYAKRRERKRRFHYDEKNVV